METTWNYYKLLKVYESKYRHSNRVTFDIFFFFFFVALMEISHRQYLLRVIPLVLFDVLKGTIAMGLSCYGVEWSFSISVLTRVRFHALVR